MFFAVIFFVLGGLLFLMSVLITVAYFADVISKDMHPLAPVIGFSLALMAFAAGIAVLQQLDRDSEPDPPAVSETYTTTADREAVVDYK